MFLLLRQYCNCIHYSDEKWTYFRVFSVYWSWRIQAFSYLEAKPCSPYMINPIIDIFLWLSSKYACLLGSFPFNYSCFYRYGRKSEISHILRLWIVVMMWRHCLRAVMYYREYTYILTIDLSKRSIPYASYSSQKRTLLSDIGCVLYALLFLFARAVATVLES